ncbi:NAD(+) kinase [Campylobacter hyointestinalis]|uniref:NAD(+) kinase n=1 Tax=Campylobacter hyointestinalis TaxID=198 RepID=UPI000DCE1DC6|nr:NAD(+) kinase [Campylobacter hyointestinalis]RAZ25835.1 NAD(+) kinase [Campylobacter hyointestinalis subsp. lawsonii]RAZ39945.1 NAD(+) kinase [Campylobacter hyointestinalis subsp. lawsonii]RAZ61010.1 NAD(+) kinase [Campylobacter hyointestinalis subsp. lawsonii]
MTEIHKNLKTIGISTRNALEQKQAIKIIEKILNDYGIEIALESRAAKELGLIGYSFEELIKKAPLIISIGGDGNFIATCRKCANASTYVFGVHTGHLGFLTDVTLEDFKGFISEFLKGNYTIERPYMLEAKFKKDDKITKKFAFNDVVLMRRKIDSTSHIEAFLNDKHFNSYYGDGVIVSSAIGSTAYNMSAGGAIIYPLCEVFSLTPVCSHSLTQRPLILPKEFKVEFKSEDDVVVLIDGQDRSDLKNYSSVEIGISDVWVNLVRHKSRDYFGVLKQKLRWGHNDK